MKGQARVGHGEDFAGHRVYRYYCLQHGIEAMAVEAAELNKALMDALEARKGK